ncbi:MAG: hypothetical protein GXY64_02920 [Bacteroidales bacterium]|nr:hypothetical protein [Bacteroidales bacterium]
MIPFLKLVADDLYQKLKGDFQNTVIIFPNQRASLFFNQYLWENAQGKTLWTPEYTTISELFASLSDVTVGDPIYLIVKLWEVYSEKMKPAKSLDQMYSLMETMLSDFQDIDNNMVDPSSLFLNIADLKEMTDFSFLEEGQREAIEQFFGKFFDREKPIQDSTDLSSLKTKFKVLWNNLACIYDDYQKALMQEGEEALVYEGMMKRLVIETLKGEEEEKRNHMDAKLTGTTYVVVGFNVLNKTEKELFRYLKQNRQAKFYWDYDVAYTRKHSDSLFVNKAGDSGHEIVSKYEAGQFISENMRWLGSEWSEQDYFDNMRKPKDITFVRSSTENAQTRYIHQWTKEHLREEEPLQESAVILCNENLLLPVLHSINNVSAINVTMGYPISATPAHSLLQALIDLQSYGYTSYAWRYKYVSAILKHPYVQQWVGHACTEKLQELTCKNMAFPRTDMFADNEKLRKVFTVVKDQQMTVYLASILLEVGHSFNNNTLALQLQRESIFTAYTLVNRLYTLQQQHESLSIGNEMLSKLIMRMMEQATIPFHGEPSTGLQVMGLLETRNLDFKNIIMLSVNEGQMPKSDKRSSLIPYTLRAAFGLTTIEKEVSLYAYYYYRLMQRAESITLLYNSSTEGRGKGEMSRFMLQTLAESEELFAKGQEIQLREFSSMSEMATAPVISVRKDEKVMEKLRQRFNDKLKLSPTAINTYMKCPLRFYLLYVEKWRPDEEVSDDVDKAMFGNIFHDVMHHLYLPYEGKMIKSSDVENLARQEGRITQLLRNSLAVHLFHEPEKDEDGDVINYTNKKTSISTTGKKDRFITLNGTQMVNLHVIKQFVFNQLRTDQNMAAQLEEQGGYWQIISMEKTYEMLQEGILLGGIIDRLDLLASPEGNRIRIVDYKTSSRQHVANTVDDLFDPEKCTNNYHIMQTFYYAKVLTNDTSPYVNEAVVPALMYCAKYDKDNSSGIVKLKLQEGKSKSELSNFKEEVGKAFDQLLTDKLHELFTAYDEGNSANEEGKPVGVFSQTDVEANCNFCEFLTFCQRHPSKGF